MVSPDNKIDPNRDSTVRPADRNLRRIPPNRNFKEVAEQVDERRYREDEKGIKGSKKKFSPFGTTAADQEEPDMSMLSPFQLAGGERDATSNSPDEKTSSEEDLKIAGSLVKGRPQDLSKDLDRPEMEDSFFLKQKRQALFGAVEQPDLTAVNPQAAALPSISHSPIVTFATSAALSGAKSASTTHLEEMVDQIAKEVYILEQKGGTETVIPLKGAFDGSRLIITEYDSAHGEMNITVDNLTATAQQLLEARKNVLMDQLSHKNIHVHIFLASTAIEPTHIAFEQSQSRERREEERSNKNQHDQQDDNPREGRRG
jgi:hypothetical protein